MQIENVCTILSFSIFKRGLDEFKVVLGDSNLRLDLAHGVQEHTIAKAAVHEDYDLGDSVHHNDIGKFQQDVLEES